MDWIFEEEDYQWWENAQHNAGLWINGSFGVGKSTIASRIIEKFRKTEDPQARKNVAFFFCKNQDSCAVLSSLAAQFLAMQKNITAEQTRIYKSWKGSGIKINPENRVNETIALIKSFLGNLVEVYIIIDGLDEHPEPVEIMKNLALLYDYSPGVVRNYKWIFTSRVNQDLFKVFKSFRNIREIRLRDLRTKKIDEDIRTFARSRLMEKLRSANLPVDLTVGHIVQKSEGCFLYASLLVIQMESQITREDIVNCLDHDWGNGIEGLQSLYNPAWSRCVRANKHFKLLMLLVTFSMKPLRRSELEAAIQNHLTTSPSGLQEGNKPIKGSLNHLCAPFVDISGDTEDPVFFLAHSKVKDYVLERNDFFTKADGNRELGSLCLKYLSDLTFSKSRTAEELRDSEFQARHPFLIYASIFWYKHLEFVEEPTERLFKQVYSFWASRNFRTCIQMQSIYAPYHFAQFIARSIFSDEHDVNYADALPGWFAKQNERGKLAALTYFRFVKEWGYYLRYHPGCLEGCMIGLIGDETFCGGIAKEGSATVALGGQLSLLEAGRAENGASSLPKAVPIRSIICVDEERGMLVASYLQPQTNR